jgi:glutaredoxin
MEFPTPEKNQFTVYSKSGCINCSKVKTLLKQKSLAFNIIDCDEFILENKEEFLTFIKEIIGKEYKMFPMVFDNNKFIGGYNETVSYFTSLQDKLLDFDISF